MKFETAEAERLKSDHQIPHWCVIEQEFAGSGQRPVSAGDLGDVTGKIAKAVGYRLDLEQPFGDNATLSRHLSADGLLVLFKRSSSHHGMTVHNDEVVAPIVFASQFLEKADLDRLSLIRRSF